MVIRVLQETTNAYVLPVVQPRLVAGLKNATVGCVHAEIVEYLS